MKKLNYDFLDCVKKMPPMVHSIPGQEYDVLKSQAALWICSQPDVINKMFDMAKNRKVIRYDAETGTWRGVDYGND